MNYYSKKLEGTLFNSFYAMKTIQRHKKRTLQKSISYEYRHKNPQQVVANQPNNI